MDENYRPRHIQGEPASSPSSFGAEDFNATQRDLQSTGYHGKHARESIPFDMAEYHLKSQNPEVGPSGILVDAYKVVVDYFKDVKTRFKGGTVAKYRDAGVALAESHGRYRADRPRPIPQE